MTGPPGAAQLRRLQRVFLVPRGSRLLLHRRPPLRRARRGSAGRRNPPCIRGDRPGRREKVVPGKALVVSPVPQLSARVRVSDFDLSALGGGGFFGAPGVGRSLHHSSPLVGVFHRQLLASDVGLCGGVGATTSQPTPFPGPCGGLWPVAQPRSALHRAPVPVHVLHLGPRPAARTPVLQPSFAQPRPRQWGPKKPDGRRQPRRRRSALLVVAVHLAVAPGAVRLRRRSNRAAGAFLEFHRAYRGP